MKRALLVSLLLAAGLLTGCGGGDSDSSDSDSSSGGDASSAAASTEDFCGGFKDLVAQFQQLGAGAKPAEAVKVLKKAGDDLADVGTPSDMPEEARAGFDFVLDEIDKLDDDASRKEIEQLGAAASKQQQTDMMAYTTYLQQTCADQLGAPQGGAPQ
jgi:hypothetical protein